MFLEIFQEKNKDCILITNYWKCLCCPEILKILGIIFLVFTSIIFFSQKFGAFFKQIQLLEALIKKTHIKN